MEKYFQKFVRRVEEEQLKIEGIYIEQENTPLFEYRWTPDLDRNIYSHTKSFLVTAIGIAIEEGLITLEDRLVDAFPDKLPSVENPALDKIKLKHLLTMSSGFNKALLMMSERRKGIGFPDYVAYMMQQPIEKAPGESFCYSTADSYLAGRMLERKTGQNLLQYIYTKILEPMSIPYPIWECCPQGHPNGGGGMFLHLKDMAKLGRLYLNDGCWEGRHIVSPDWVRQATTYKIDVRTPDDLQNREPKEGSWHIGYGYQFWLCPYPGSYRADGSFGQITLVLPESRMLISVQCPENGDFNKVKDALHNLIIDMIK